MQAVILAAGRGKRLGRLSRKRSKAMQPVLGVPILQRVIERLRKVDFSEFLVAFSPNDHMLQNYFRTNPSADHQVMLIEQQKPLGTAHALGCVATGITGDFLLSAVDNIVSTVDLRRMCAYWESNKHRLDGLLALVSAEPDQIRASAGVRMEHQRVVRIVEKPASVEGLSPFASISLYIFSVRVLDHLCHVRPSERGEYELTEAIQRMIQQRGSVEGLEISGRLTLTDPEDLLHINRHYLRLPSTRAMSAAVRGRGEVEFIEPVYIGPDVAIGAGSRIGPEVYLEKGCEIGAGCVVQRAVILKDVMLPSGSEVFDQVLCA